MSQETQIGSLSGGISDEDSKLVDSILNDINNSGSQQPQRPQQQQGNPQQQQPTPEQMKMMQQQQMAMRQQQMAQQQVMAQQQAMNNNQKMNIIQKDSNDILDNIKTESKNIMVIVFLCILFNIEQIDSIFKSQNMFLSESGGLNMQAVFFKAILIGVVFYLVKTYLL